MVAWSVDQPASRYELLFGDLAHVGRAELFLLGGITLLVLTALEPR